MRQPSLKLVPQWVFCFLAAPLYAARRWYRADYPATRARQSWSGGLRLDPGGMWEGFAYAPDPALSLVNAIATNWLRRNTKADTVLLR